MKLNKIDESGCALIIAIGFAFLIGCFIGVSIESSKTKKEAAMQQEVVEARASADLLRKMRSERIKNSIEEGRIMEAIMDEKKRFIVEEIRKLEKMETDPEKKETLHYIAKKVNMINESD